MSMIPEGACAHCWGEGKVANTEEREPWSTWANLPPGSDLAVRAGLVSPMDCEPCRGTGKAARAEA